MSVQMTQQTSTTALAQRWQALLAEEGQLRIRNAAMQLGVSEAELLATKIGAGVVRLSGDFKALVTELEALGSVMALTRNDAMVHEKTGQYKNISLHGMMGLALGEIDLRIFFNRFNFGFAVTEESAHGTRHSLQFFAANGEAVHKVYANESTNMAEFSALVERYRATEQVAGLTLDAEHVEKQAQGDLLSLPDDFNAEEFRDAWSSLKDVHHFQSMLNKHQVERIPAYQTVGTDYAQRLSPAAFEAALTLAAEAQLPIMVFVGSQGVVQIHTGTVSKLLRTGPWFNVLDPTFNLHANTELVSQVWLVRKPTTDGLISSLEMFDAQGRQLALMFGERKPGQVELEGWRQLLQALQTRFDKVA